MMARTLPFVPPAPDLPTHDLPAWRLLWNLMHSSLALWPDHAFDAPTVRTGHLGFDVLLVNDPAAVRHVLGSHAANYRRPQLLRRVARALGGDGLWSAEGAEWSRQRRLLAPAFTSGSLNRLLPHVRDAGQHLVDSLAIRRQANLAGAFEAASSEALLQALFSLSASRARDRLQRLARDHLGGWKLASLADAAATSDRLAFLHRGRSLFQRRWWAASGAIIAERRSQPIRADRRDFLDLLLDLRDPDSGAGLSDAEIRDHCATLYLTGAETSARLLFWASYLLTQDLTEQSRVRAEIAAFPPDRVRNIGDLQKWQRLRNVLLEALRLYPPTPHILRQAIGTDEVGGEIIHPGTLVWVSPWITQRHRKLWHQPQAFLPDRFACKAMPWTQMPGYIPFGAGPRLCIGLSFALAEAQMMLAMLLQRYELRLPRDDRPVLPIGRRTILPSYQPMFGLEAV